MKLLKMQLHLDWLKGLPFAFKICLATIGVAFLSAVTSVAALFYFMEVKRNEKSIILDFGIGVVPVPMTMDIVQQITATGTGKDFAKTLISNTYTFTGKVYAEEADYVGVGIRVPNADGELVGYDYYSSLSFYVYLPAEELASVRYDDTISFVGTITDIFREERKDEMSSEFSFPVTVIVLGDAYITE